MQRNAAQSRAVVLQACSEEEIRAITFADGCIQCNQAVRNITGADVAWQGLDAGLAIACGPPVNRVHSAQAAERCHHINCSLYRSNASVTFLVSISGGLKSCDRELPVVWHHDVVAKGCQESQ